MRALLITAVLLVSALPGVARPCELVEGPDPASFPESDTTLNARPVFFALVATEPRLTRVGEGPIALELVDALSGTFTRDTLTRAWRPVEPLTAGRYRFDGAASAGGGEMAVEFFVDPSLPNEAPALEGADLEVTLDDPDEGGCGVMSSCDGVDFTMLEVLVPEDSAVSALRLEVRNPKTGLRRIELVRVPEFGHDGHRTVVIWNNPNR